MKILMLAHQVSYPIHDGYNLHNYHYARHLQGRHEIHLIALGNEPVPDEFANVFASVRMLRRRDPPRDRMLVGRIARSLSADEVHDFDPFVFAAIHEAVWNEGYDLVWASGAKMLVYTRRLHRVPVLADIADSGLLDARKQLARARTPRQIAMRTRELISVRRFERAYFPHAAAVSVVAEDDRASVLELLPAAKVPIVNNGVDHEYFVPLGHPRKDASLVYLGAMNFLPNAEGSIYFCRQVLPLILSEVPETVFSIVGKDPTPEVSELAGPSVEVTGMVDDVRPWLDAAAVFVCPLLSGAGIKNKILQAWAMEKPVVATSISCGGLRIRPGENILVADGKRDFADAVLKLLRDPGLCARMGRAGRETVTAHYSWEAKAAEMDAILRDVAGLDGPSGAAGAGQDPAGRTTQPAG
ncbi:MAG: glycosyltransferase family 4 protein [Planctomycetota bacterium]|jgi:glycosyltransferase involved in cell wall biosynthesis